MGSDARWDYSLGRGFIWDYDEAGARTSAGAAVRGVETGTTGEVYQVPGDKISLAGVLLSADHKATVGVTDGSFPCFH